MGGRMPERRIVHSASWNIGNLGNKGRFAHNKDAMKCLSVVGAVVLSVEIALHAGLSPYALEREAR
jgi:hypothetical protein